MVSPSSCVRHVLTDMAAWQLCFDLLSDLDSAGAIGRDESLARSGMLHMRAEDGFGRGHRTTHIRTQDKGT